MFKTALDYHNYTSYDRLDMRGHHMDWPNQPSVFKEYSGIEPIPLVSPVQFQEASLGDLLLEDVQPRLSSSFDYSSLSSTLILAHAITAKTRYSGSYFHYRSVASAGALYPFETYVCAIDLEGLGSGLYHHNVPGNALEKLFDGVSTSDLDEILSLDIPIRPGLVFFLTSIFFRSAWKYRDRAYRYHLLDTGHLLENLTLALKYHGLKYSILFDFDDIKTNRFLRIDPIREVCLATIVVSSESENRKTWSGDSEASSSDLYRFSKVSDGEVDYPSIHDIHTLTVTQNLKPYSESDNLLSLGLNLNFIQEIGSPAKVTESLGYPDAVFARRSLRNFVKGDIASQDFIWLLRLLGSSSGEMDSDPSLNGVSAGLLASHVQGLSSGFYVYNAESRSLYLAKEGEMLDRMTHICLDQAWLANCAAHFLLMANMVEIEKRFGPRGYRRALLSAGRLGQRLYIATTSLRLGCCGIGAFYDSEAASLLGLNQDSRLTYLLGVGPIKKRSQNNP